jgi:hypothetical protein
MVDELVLGPENVSANRGVKTIGTNYEIELFRLTGAESHLDALLVLDEVLDRRTESNFGVTQNVEELCVERIARYFDIILALLIVFCIERVGLQRCDHGTGGVHELHPDEHAQLRLLEGREDPHAACGLERIAADVNGRSPVANGRRKLDYADLVAKLAKKVGQREARSPSPRNQYAHLVSLFPTAPHDADCIQS